MKLLITTQKVDKDDPILGFFHAWIIEFAKHFEFVTVICLYEGKHDLPENVKVLSLGKEERQSRLQYLIHFYWYIWHERKNYDVVFVHMNQIYVVLGGLFWRILGKKISLWYTHRAVSINLRIATLLSNEIFTSARESFNVKTKKLHVVGHGIDINKFKKQGNFSHKSFTMVSVGRITRIKNLEILIQAIALLKDRKFECVCDIVGPQVTPDDGVYFMELQKLVAEKGLSKNVFFRGSVTQEKISEFFWKTDLNVNLTPTGGIDKVVIEGIAASAIPLVSNKAFLPIFGPYSDELIFELKDVADLTDKIENISKISYKPALLANLQMKITIDFSLPSVIENVSSIMQGGMADSMIR